MNQAVEKMAEDFGIPPENVRYDDFGGWKFKINIQINPLMILPQFHRTFLNL